MKQIQQSPLIQLRTKCLNGLVYVGCALGIAAAFTLANVINLLS